MWSWRTAKRFFILLIGGTIVLVGLALVVLPGPAMVVIPIGLAILATEFVWAKTLLDKLKARAQQMAGMVTGKPAPAPPVSNSAPADAPKCDDQP